MAFCWLRWNTLQYNVLAIGLRLLVITGIRFIPSSGNLASGFVSANARIVAVQSIVIATCSVVEPAGIEPGHRINAGTLMPPSFNMGLPPLYLPMSEYLSPPLSL